MDELRRLPEDVSRHPSHGPFGEARLMRELAQLTRLHARYVRSMSKLHCDRSHALRDRAFQTLLGNAPAYFARAFPND